MSNGSDSSEELSDPPFEARTLPSLRDAALEARQRPAPILGPAMATGRKFDGGKHRMWLLGPLWRPLRAVVRVLEFGATKYAPNNWQLVRDEEHELGPPVKRYGDAMLRHVAAWQEGETRDSETGLHPLAHAVCDGLFLLWFLVDDNGQPSSAEEVARRSK